MGDEKKEREREGWISRGKENEIKKEMRNLLRSYWNGNQKMRVLKKK